MFYQQALRLEELVEILPSVPECCFTIDSSSPKKEYHVAVYKYLDDFYILHGDSIRQLMKEISEQTGNEDYILAAVETCLEANSYILVDKKFVDIDLKTLLGLSTIENTEIHFFRISE